MSFTMHHHMSHPHQEPARRTLRWGVSTWVCCLAIGSVGPVHAADQQSERARIQRELNQIESRFNNATAQCSGVFAVNQCLDQARAERRTAREGLKAQQHVLDEQVRRDKAAQRLESIAHGKAAADVAKPGYPASGAADAQAPHSPAPLRGRAGPRETGAPAAPRHPHAGRAPVDTTSQKALAAERAAKTARSAQEAEKHRALVQSRNREALAKKPLSVPLPVPSAAASTPR